MKFRKAAKVEEALRQFAQDPQGDLEIHHIWNTPRDQLNRREQGIQDWLIAREKQPVERPVTETEQAAA